MASINGVSIKNLKSFMGHEGPCLQGNIYIDGKKVGFWSQDSWGGPDTFDFNTSVLESRISEYLKSNKVIDEYALLDRTIAEIDWNNLPMLSELSTESFITRLIDLIEDEKHFKSSSKKGYVGVGVIKSHYAKDANYYSEGRAAFPPNVDLKAEVEKISDKYVKPYPEKYIVTYFSLDDFNI